MSELIIKIHNAQTNEVIEREMTIEEKTQLEAQQASILAQVYAEAEAATKKAEAEAKLAALGLTADDLKALGLG